MYKGKELIFTGVVFELFGLCLGGFYLGDLIDQHMGWKNFAAPFMVLLLFVGWIVHLIYLLKQYEKDESNSDQNSNP